jgi:hypothetical protein
MRIGVLRPIVISLLSMGLFLSSAAASGSLSVTVKQGTAVVQGFCVTCAITGRTASAAGSAYHSKDALLARSRAGEAGRVLSFPDHGTGLATSFRSATASGADWAAPRVDAPMASIHSVVTASGPSVYATGGIALPIFHDPPSPSAPAPEPGTLSLLGLGGVMLGRALHRRLCRR